MERGLGWFSVGLGLAEVAAPGLLARSLGMENRTEVVRLCGLRELCTGIGLLAQRGPGKPAPWLWSRVGGDALDLTLLLSALTPDNPKRRNAEVAVALVAGVTIVDMAAAKRASEKQREAAGPSADPGEIQRSLTILRSAEELYELWRDPQTMRRIMADFAEVTPPNGDGRMHWRLNAPLGRRLEWDSQVVEERPGEMVRWRSSDGGDLPMEGTVQFRTAPGDRGTEAKLHVHFDPPGGAFGGAAAKLMGVAPDMIAGKALRRFKALAETGEVPTTYPQPAARADKDQARSTSERR